jgi:hypothetical protein
MNNLGGYEMNKKEYDSMIDEYGEHCRIDIKSTKNMESLGSVTEYEEPPYHSITTQHSRSLYYCEKFDVYVIHYYGHGVAAPGWEIATDDEKKELQTKIKAQKASEVLESIDWKEFNSRMTFAQAGDKVIIWMDGSISDMSSGTHPHPDECENILHIYHPCGMGNDSFEYQLEGFVTEHGDDYITEDGRILTLNEALSESIDEGDFTEWIEGWKREALQVIEEGC